MKMIIDIPEEIYDCIKINGIMGESYRQWVSNLIAHGAILPKGHGRLYDEKDLKACMIHDDSDEGCGYLDERDLVDIEAVVSADTEERNVNRYGFE